MRDKAINHGFSAEQLAWLKAQFSAATSSTGFDKATIMWIVGGLVAQGVVALGLLYTEIGSVRGQVQANTVALARIEAKQDGLATDVSEIKIGQSKIIDLLLEGRS